MSFLRAIGQFEEELCERVNEKRSMVGEAEGGGSKS